MVSFDKNMYKDILKFAAIQVIFSESQSRLGHFSWPVKLYNFNLIGYFWHFLLMNDLFLWMITHNCCRQHVMPFILRYTSSSYGQAIVHHHCSVGWDCRGVCGHPASDKFNKLKVGINFDLIQNIRSYDSVFLTIQDTLQLYNQLRLPRIVVFSKISALKLCHCV